MNFDSTEINDVFENLKTLDIQGFILVTALSLKGLPATASYAISLYRLVDNGEVKKDKVEEFEKLNVLPILSQAAQAIEKNGAEDLIEKMVFYVAQKYNFTQEEFNRALDWFPMSASLSAAVWGYVVRNILSEHEFEEPPDDGDWLYK